MKIFRGWVPALVMASVLVALAQADAAHLKENARKHKIVYQLDDAGIDKAKFVPGKHPQSRLRSRRMAERRIP